ncbi:MAG: hypothetical protein ACLP5V_05895 [Candidatus Bathyarchaeia archaeon]
MTGRHGGNLAGPDPDQNQPTLPKPHPPNLPVEKLFLAQTPPSNSDSPLNISAIKPSGSSFIRIQAKPTPLAKPPGNVVGHLIRVTRPPKER